MWKSNYTLCLSSLIFIIPLAYILYRLQQNKHMSTINSILSYMMISVLCLNIILSILFWYNPVKNSYVHILDRTLVRISLVLFIIYFCLQRPTLKEIATFVFILCAIRLFAYYSNYFSSIDWCNSKHIQYHSFFHLFCGLGCMYVLI